MSNTNPYISIEEENGEFYLKICDSSIRITGKIIDMEEVITYDPETKCYAVKTKKTIDITNIPEEVKLLLEEIEEIMNPSN